MKALIIEDEQLAIDAIQKLLKLENGFITIVGIARDGDQALRLIEQLTPELLFLDINIPVMNGVELLKHITYQPLIVFTTAYDEYAIKAFELNAVDYLLKPISRDRFMMTMHRLKTLPAEYLTQKHSVLRILEELSTAKQFTSVSVKTGDRILFIGLEDITHFFAEDKYVSLNTIESKQQITSFTIQELAEKLPSNFIRISRSVIINRHHICEARKLFGKKYDIKLKDVKSTVVSSGGLFGEAFVKLL